LALDITLIAGPNGAGKTTFASTHLQKEMDAGFFLNADNIEKSLNSETLASPSFQAGRLALAMRRDFLQSRQSFILETTLATRNLLVFLKEAKFRGYTLIIHYLWITNPKLCDFRVKDRVSKGGHNIPVEIISRRYRLGLCYFSDYFDLADKVSIYSADEFPQLIGSQEKGQLTIHDTFLYGKFLAQMREARG
jgi:predicted ABC-type ATPase